MLRGAVTRGVEGQIIVRSGDCHGGWTSLLTRTYTAVARMPAGVVVRRILSPRKTTIEALAGTDQGGRGVREAARKVTTAGAAP